MCSYSLMRYCWNKSPNERPTFAWLVDKLNHEVTMHHCEDMNKEHATVCHEYFVLEKELSIDIRV